MILARAPKSRMVDHAVMAVYEGARERLEVPDWALDRHTARGRRIGRGQQHFFDEGAVLANAADLDDPYAEEGRAAVSRRQRSENRGAGRARPLTFAAASEGDTGRLRGPYRFTLTQYGSCPNAAAHHSLAQARRRSRGRASSTSMTQGRDTLVT